MFEGYTFWMDALDSPPPHVLVLKSGTYCVITIGDDDEAPEVTDWGDMRPTQAGRAVWIVYQSRETLLAQWRRTHAA